jgi:hypothetical protein
MPIISNLIDAVTIATPQYNYNLDQFIGQPMTASTLSALHAQVRDFHTHATGTASTILVNPNNQIYFNAEGTTFNIESTSLIGNILTVNGGRHYYNTSLVSEEDLAAHRKQALQAQMRSRMRANWHVRSSIRFSYPIGANPTSVAELKARRLLRDMVSEREWRCYVTNGYVMVRGGSGKWYRLHQRENIQVYEKGVKINSLCVHTHEDCPPTDHIINMKTLIEIEEDQIYKRANVREILRHVETKQKSCRGL